MSSSDITNHNCYDYYELQTREQLFKCDGCGTEGLGQRYFCVLCGNELHRECRFPPTTATHEFFPRSVFKFYDKPFNRILNDQTIIYAKSCDACAKEIKGYNYHCERDDLDLHPRCRTLERRLVTYDTIFILDSKVSSKCIWCKKRTPSGASTRGWSYVSTCKKIRFHIHCLSEILSRSRIENGEIVGLEGVAVRDMVGTSGGGSIRRNHVVFQKIKTLLSIVFSALLGDPTILISEVMVDLISQGLD